MTASTLVLCRDGLVVVHVGGERELAACSGCAGCTD